MLPLIGIVVALATSAGATSPVVRDVNPPQASPTTGGATVSFNVDDLDVRYADVSVAGRSSYGVTDDGEVYSWGLNFSGQLGHGDTNSRNTPGLIVFPDEARITQLSTSSNYGVDRLAGHVLALSADGRVYSWGNNDSGQLGDGSTTNTSEPNVVSFPDGTVITSIASGGAGGRNGGAHNFAVASDGTLYAWGGNTWGQLGDGTTATRFSPTKIVMPDGVAISSVTAGQAHSAAISTTGDLYTWGANFRGEIGDGTFGGRKPPQRINVAGEGTVVTQASAGEASTIAVTSTGEVYSWGAGLDGRLGNGSDADQALPGLVPIPGDQPITAVSTGQTGSSFALSAAGEVYAWGNNEHGSLGGYPGPSQSTPTLVDLAAGTTTIRAGRQHALAVTTDGHIYTWGTLPGATHPSNPQRIASARTVTSMQVGDAPAPSFQHLAPDTITVVTPPQPPGLAPVAVTTTSHNGLRPDTQTLPDMVRYLHSPTLPEEAPPPATIGKAYSYELSATDDESARVAVSDGALPDGLQLEDGTISGTPSKSATTQTFTVENSNVLGSVTGTYTLTVWPGASTLTPEEPSATSTQPAHARALPATGASMHALGLAALLLTTGLGTLGVKIVARKRKHLNHS